MDQSHSDRRRRGRRSANRRAAVHSPGPRPSQSVCGTANATIAGCSHGPCPGPTGAGLGMMCAYVWKTIGTRALMPLSRNATNASRTAVMWVGLRRADFVIAAVAASPSTFAACAPPARRVALRPSDRVLLPHLRTRRCRSMTGQLRRRAAAGTYPGHRARRCDALRLPGKSSSGAIAKLRRGLTTPATQNGIGGPAQVRPRSRARDKAAPTPIQPSQALRPGRRRHRLRRPLHLA